MKICFVHNEYGRPSGEEIVVGHAYRLLAQAGHSLGLYTRSSQEIERSRFGKAKAFFSGIYSHSSRIAFRRSLRENRPEIVHTHNLFPLISPSVLIECRRAGLPVVMTVHNYRLVCPNGLHMVRGQVCEKCIGGREYMCVINRCEESLGKSVGYALRNWVARRFGFFRDNVTMYAALTEFQRRRLIAAGFPEDRIAVVPNMVNGIQECQPAGLGDYVGYVGRISPEKDIPSLLKAAERNPSIAFKAAGACERMPHLMDQAPASFEFLGHLDPSKLAAFYRDSRMIVLCSTCFEGFPTVLVEAMLHGKPIICSRIGGLPEIVDDGVTGLLFEPGNAEDLAEKINYLWNRPELCRQMGMTGREKALREYSPEKYYERLMGVYQKAIALGAGGPK